MEEIITGEHGYNQVVWNSELKNYEEVKLDLVGPENEKSKFLEMCDRVNSSTKAFRYNNDKTMLELGNTLALSGQVPFASFNFTTSGFEFNN